MYIINKKILKLIENNKVQGKEIKAYSIDIGTYQNLKKFKSISKKMKS